MFVVLERKTVSGWFPRGGDPKACSVDYVMDIDKAEVFNLRLTADGLVSSPPMPKTDVWEIRQVEVRLK